MSDQNIDQLRAEAAMRRQAIATDLELMGDRVSPTRIAERRKAAFRQRVHGVRNSVFGTSDRHRMAGAQTANEAYGYPTGYDTPTYATGTSTSGGQDGGSSITDKASSAVDTIKQAAPSSLGEATEGNPFGAAVIGFGIGMLAASLLPSSPDEQRAARKLQGHLEQAGTQLGTTAKEAVQNVAPEAQQAVQDLKDSAKESVESVKSEAQTKAEDVKGTAQEQAQAVKAQA